MWALCVFLLRWKMKAFKSTRKSRIFWYLILIEKGTEFKQLKMYDEKIVELTCVFYLKSGSIGARFRLTRRDSHFLGQY